MNPQSYPKYFSPSKQCTFIGNEEIFSYIFYIVIKVILLLFIRIIKFTLRIRQITNSAIKQINDECNDDKADQQWP